MGWNNSPLWLVDSSLAGVDADTGCEVWSAPFLWDDRMTPLQDLDETEQQVQELYAPSPKKETLVLKIDTTQLQKQLKEMLDKITQSMYDY